MHEVVKHHFVAFSLTGWSVRQDSKLNLVPFHAYSRFRTISPTTVVSANKKFICEYMIFLLIL